tara:strand:- start:1609 stop:2811 length:1203 start_codon:yes stop_codon:yes gene_type:complete
MKVSMKNNLIEFLDLGFQPLANKFLKKTELRKKEKKYRLKVCFNKKNYLVTIKKPISSNKMFDDKYPYRSAMSKLVLNSFKKLSKKIKKSLKPKKILEIGSNDGSFMRNFHKSKIVGIEPCKNVEKITRKNSFNTFPFYWNNKTAKYLLKKFKKFDLIFSANTISHIEDLNQVFTNINLLLSENGTLIIEDPSLLLCLKTNTYDQFYNEHIYVFSTVGLQEILKKNNLEIYKIEKINVHGGSNRYFIKKVGSKRKIENSLKNQIKEEIKYGLKSIKAYKNFAKRVIYSKKKLLELFNNLKKSQSKIIGYGATAKSTTILNYCRIDRSYIHYFLDTTPDKQNKFTPGTKIKIYKYNKCIPHDVDYAFLGAWNFKDEIFKKEVKYIRRGGKFIIHTPFPKII